ncbi:hypothetical protein ACFSQD_13890 [Flavihumibacter stibioxidans]|nr:hypothetical protein [Flavihumibacter stibioxidans]
MKAILNIVVFTLWGQFALAQPLVQHRGKMSKIGQENRVDAEILVDSIRAKNLYALGPVEGLRGEIIVWNSQPFVAAVTAEKKPFLRKKVKDLKAIFLVYADVPKWDTVLLTTNIPTMNALQDAITKAAHQAGIDTASAFPFLLYGKIQEGKGHIMYRDTAVRQINPDVIKAANHGQAFQHQEAQMLGFYSQHHQRIFTSPNSFLHIHYRLRNKYQAGHLDAVSFDVSTPIKLLLPHKQ